MYSETLTSTHTDRSCEKSCAHQASLPYFYHQFFLVRHRHPRQRERLQHLCSMMNHFQSRKPRHTAVTTGTTQLALLTMRDTRARKVLHLPYHQFCQWPRKLTLYDYMISDQLLQGTLEANACLGLRSPHDMASPAKHFWQRVEVRFLKQASWRVLPISSVSNKARQ